MSSPSPTPLSACIITFNEADRIEACLKALEGLVDEIILVDSGSKDNTVEIARQMGAKVFHNDWVGYGPQKRKAEDYATHDWLLNLDADEVLTLELNNEIKSLMQNPTKFYGFRLPLITVYPGDKKPRLWANGHNQIRLYDRRKMRFSDSLVHDSVEPGHWPIGQLKHIAYHFSFRSMQHLRDKQESYTTLQAKALKKKTWVLLLRLPFEYPLMFLRYLLVRTHITGGLKGIEISHIAALYRTKRLWKILQAKYNTKSN
jgi:glycosyltransferase involved in cell wall biosynthesis